jgi:hypothetical protein
MDPARPWRCGPASSASEPQASRPPRPWAVGHHIQQATLLQVDQAGHIAGGRQAGGLEEAGLIQPERGDTVQARGVLHQRGAVVSHRPHDGRPADPQVAQHARGRRPGCGGRQPRPAPARRCRSPAPRRAASGRSGGAVAGLAGRPWRLLIRDPGVLGAITPGGRAPPRWTTCAARQRPRCSGRQPAARAPGSTPRQVDGTEGDDTNPGRMAIRQPPRQRDPQSLGHQTRRTIPAALLGVGAPLAAVVAVEGGPGAAAAATGRT